MAYIFWRHLVHNTHILIFDNKYIYLSYNHMKLTQRELAAQEALRTEQEQHVA
jgi:hypothetical protein